MILHICPRDAWAKAAATGWYEAASLATEGFLHCSPADWAHVPATRLFHGRTDLVLLEIDEARLDAPVVWEQGSPPEPDGRLFPHVYGRLPVSAVVAVHDYRPASDGTFPPVELWRKASGARSAGR